MKIALMSAAAVAVVIASPAMAAKIGNDAIGIYDISGTATDFCVLGSATDGNSNGDNVVIDTGSTSAGTGAYSDAQITIQTLQNNDDHAKAWRAVFNLRHSVCNTPYTVKATSDNGGLKYQGQVQGGNDFYKKLHYTVAANFGSNHSGATDANDLKGAGGGTLLTSASASSGDFRLVFDGDAQRNKYLLSGDYTDRVVVTMAPASGTPS
jgi:hypothetical protein